VSAFGLSGLDHLVGKIALDVACKYICRIIVPVTILLEGLHDHPVEFAPDATSIARADSMLRLAAMLGRASAVLSLVLARREFQARKGKTELATMLSPLQQCYRNVPIKKYFYILIIFSSFGSQPLQ
jgi:hypothetical protein